MRGAFYIALVGAVIAASCAVREVSAATAVCQGVTYLVDIGAVCTPQGPYCPAYPVDGQQGRFLMPVYYNVAQNTNYFTPASDRIFNCYNWNSRTITREEMGKTLIPYAVNPQYTGNYNVAVASQARDGRGLITYWLVDGTGERPDPFWDRTLALKTWTESYVYSRNIGSVAGAWIAHLDINAGALWSYYNLQMISQTCVNTPYKDENNNFLPTCVRKMSVRKPFEYATGPVNSPYIDIPYGDTSLYTHNGVTAIAIVPPATVCQVDCNLKGPTFQCNIAGTKCECIPPLLPVFSADGVNIVSCRKGNMVQFDWDWPVPQLAHKSNAAGSDYLPLDNARGTCFTDASSALLANATDQTTGRTAWCRDYGGLSFTEQCNGNGWHLQLRNRLDQYPAFLDVDCRCDSGFSGKRCHAPCWRRFPTDSCEGDPVHSCDTIGNKRSTYSNAVCEPNFLFPIAPVVTLFRQPQPWIFQIDRYQFQDTSLQQQFCVGSFNQPTVCFPTVYSPTVCFLDASLFRMPGSLSSLTARPQQSVRKSPRAFGMTLCDHTANIDRTAFQSQEFRYYYFRSRKFIPLEFVVLNENNYQCSLVGSPNATVQARNSSTNPCAYGTNPSVNPLHFNEPGGDGLVSSPLNYNSVGLDRHIVLSLSLSLPFDQQDYRRVDYFQGQGLLYYPMAVTRSVREDTRNKDLVVRNFDGTRRLLDNDAPNTPYDKFVDQISYKNDGSRTFRCKGTQLRVNINDVCTVLTCPLGTAGQYCEILCDACQAGQVCNEGKTGNGKCVCTDPTSYLNPVTGLCSTSGCGPVNNLCSGAGTCVTSTIAQYCACNAGFDGAICQLSRGALGYIAPAASVVYDECDCGAVWKDYTLIDRLNPMPAGLAVLSDYSPILAPLVQSVLRSGVVNVGNSDQARALCYRDALCAGFAMHVLTDYWRQTAQPDPGLSVYRAIFLYKSNPPNAPANAGIVFPSGIAVELHQVSRYDGYACPISELQTQNWYYNVYYSTVQPYCQTLVAAYAAAYPTAQPLPSNACSNTQMFISHWRYAGHLARLQPNPSCVLSPTLYSPESYCKGSRCPTNGNVPCSGVGVCSQDALGKYVCACEKFSSAASTGALGLNGNPRYLGNSCQFSVSTLCVQPQAATICSDNPSRCKPRLVFNSNFYNGDSLDVSNSTDYIPFCDCSAINLQVSPSQHTTQFHHCHSQMLVLSPDQKSILMMQFEKLRKFQSRSSVRLRSHISFKAIMAPRKRKRAASPQPQATNFASQPFWWNDHVQYTSSQLRDTDTFTTADLIPRPIQSKQRVTTTSRKKNTTPCLVRLKRIRILPTPEQKQQLHQWFGIHRQLFNATIDRHNAGIKGSDLDHRNVVTHMPGIYSNNNLSPSDLRQAACKTASSAFAATRLSLKARKKDPNQAYVGHQTKKDATHQFKITAHGKRPCVFETGAFEFWPSRKLGPIKAKRDSDVVKLLPHYPDGIINKEVIVQFERPNTYHLLIPCEIAMPAPMSVKLVMATDPGVRTFHTTFDSNQVYTKHLEGGINTIVKLCKKADRLQSHIDTHYDHVLLRLMYTPEGKDYETMKMWRNQLQQRKKQLGFLRLKIANVKRDMHWKLAASWCSTYSDMIVPKFNSSQMTKRFTRKIKKKSVKEMMHWGHHNFRQRLISKAAEKGARVHELSEHYTTKTCGKCGHMREMGGKKIYECTREGCGYVADRDHNGAFNIFIKNIDTALMCNPLAALQ